MLFLKSISKQGTSARFTDLKFTTFTARNVVRKKLLYGLVQYYPHPQIQSHRAKTFVAAILYASVLGTSRLLACDHAIYAILYVAPVICFFQYLLWAICLKRLFVYFNVNYSFNHFLTTVNTVFVLRRQV